nr:putative integron gene cassette protein [uncultured bacterium]
MTKLTTRDSNGHDVRIGDSIRVLSLDMDAFDFLQENERNDIESMIDEVFEVEDTYKSGTAKITKSLNRGRGRSETHTITLLPMQFQLVQSTLAGV